MGTEWSAGASVPNSHTAIMGISWARTLAVWWSGRVPLC